MLEDLIIAHNEAKKFKTKTTEEITKATGNFGIQALSGLSKHE